MADYNSVRFDTQRIWIETAREAGMEWEQVRLGGGDSLAELEEFLAQQKRLSFWKITIDEWLGHVDIEKEGEEQRLNLAYSEKSAIIGDDYHQENDVQIPTRKASCWQKYRQYLLEEQRFLPEDVHAIQTSTHRILQKLNIRTEGEAVKGLVVGNVQSGKTANMAALMAMAADYGFNMFIVLSGTIESLRLQTLNRLISDLNRPGCNISWEGIDRPKKNCSLVDKAQNKHFEKTSNIRYLTVSLKNSSRLKNLIQWLHDDSKSANQMKILIIDDESDQAGVNTKSVDEEERTKINQLLVNLVGNKTEKGEPADDCFAAMNYIGYTATPYANVLNEARPESLYPRDFIATLQPSHTYFGPQQIFGDRNSNNYKGLNIIRSISDEEVAVIKDVHKGNEDEFPDELENSLAWFLCCVATMRIRKSKKPVSMLIHTSQLNKHHNQIHRIVQEWFDNDDNYILEICKYVWTNETGNFSKEDLFEDYPGFSSDADRIQDYPAFSDIEPEIRLLLNAGLTNIRLGEDQEFQYSRGIHLCVDNCKNNGVKEDGVFMRLAYPDKAAGLDYATAFIVIGGATLSRGLTIEGLVSTYFLRSTKQADTLMQMGRWFGYRRGYELLQRIWLTENAVRQFEFLADMDSELRENIYRMELFRKKPKDYAVLVKQSPSVKLIKISSANRIQSAIQTEMNYSGMHSQTQLFVDDADTIHSNYELTEKFLLSLNTPMKGIGDYGKNSYIWRKVHYKTIFDGLLKKYSFDEGNRIFSVDNLQSIEEWVCGATKERQLADWNVILFGLAKGNEQRFAGCSINKVVRTRKRSREESPGTIDIKILTDPTERIADVDYENLTETGRLLYRAFTSDKAYEIREDAGLGKTPTIVIYVVDEHSGEKSRDPSKRALDIKEPLIGLSVNIPGDRINDSYSCSVMIDLQKFGLGTDIEDAEEDED